MKKLNFKKIAAMSMAAMMAVSAMSISAFAEDEILVAELEDSDGNVVSVYEDDLVNGSYSMESDGLTITVGIKQGNNIFTARSATGKFSTNIPSVVHDLDVYGTQTLTFSAAKLETVNSPYLYKSTNSKKVVCDFQANAKYNTSVKGNVIVQDSSGSSSTKTYSVSLGDTNIHSINVAGMSSTQTAYASVYNGYSSAVSGTCIIQ